MPTGNTISSPPPVLRQTARAGVFGRKPAFAIVEAVVCVAITGLSVVASMAALGSMARANTVQKDQCRASLIARQMLDEIMQYPYQDPTLPTTTLGPETGEVRATFNDVDDFNGWTESPPADKSGSVIAGYIGWTRSVVVDWVTPANPTTTQGTESGLKRITVTVKDAKGKITKLVGLRADTGPYEKVPTTPTTYTSWVGITLQVGTDPSNRAAASVNPLNQIP